jgi:hypothetical protein
MSSDAFNSSALVKKPLAATQSLGDAVAALRKLLGKHNPDDFPEDSPAFEALQLDFVRDVLKYL